MREGAALQESLSNLEAAHSHDLENFLGKLNAREEDIVALRGEVKAATEAAEAFKVQLEESRRKADEETRRAVEKAVEKARKEGAGKVVDEAAANEMKMKRDAAQVRAGRRRPAAGCAPRAPRRAPTPLPLHLPISRRPPSSS